MSNDRKIVLTSGPRCVGVGGGGGWEIVVQLGDDLSFPMTVGELRFENAGEEVGRLVVEMNLYVMRSLLRESLGIPECEVMPDAQRSVRQLQDTVAKLVDILAGEVR